MAPSIRTRQRIPFTGDWDVSEVDNPKNTHTGVKTRNAGRVVCRTVFSRIISVFGDKGLPSFASLYCPIIPLPEIAQPNAQINN